MLLAFADPTFEGNALAELERLIEDGTIKVLDLIVLIKDFDENCTRIEFSDLPPEQAAAVAFIELIAGGLFDDEDAAVLCEGMVPGSTVVAMAIENTWAVNLANAINAAGGELAWNSRVPSVVVEEAFEALS